MIAKSFYLTGRVAATKRRLRQNNRQLLEIFYPGGLERNGDGWKLSTRVRFVHARIRHLLANSDDWNHEAWGTPVSAAHLGFAISVFSQRLLEYSIAVGAKFNEKEKESVLAIWRYTGLLMGIPESILYTNAAEAKRIYRITPMCEPPPDADSSAMANALIQSIPGIANITDPDEKENVIKLAYRLSRGFLGNRLADQFQYPKTSNIGVLFLYRMKQRFQRFLKDHPIDSIRKFHSASPNLGLRRYWSELQDARSFPPVKIERLVSDAQCSTIHPCPSPARFH